MSTTGDHKGPPIRPTPRSPLRTRWARSKKPTPGGACPRHGSDRSLFYPGTILVINGKWNEAICLLKVGFFICLNHEFVNDHNIGIGYQRKRLQAEPHR